MRIERFDPGAADDLLRACFDVVVSGQPEDDPNVPAASERRFRASWRDGFAGNPQQAWAATSGAGAVLGCYLLMLPEQDNRTNAFCTPTVAPAARRRGIGTALLAHAAEQASRAGRTLLLSDARVGAPGQAFAAAVGARPVLREVRRVLDVGPDLAARLPGLRASATGQALGYSVRQWQGVTPDDLISGVCAISAAMADAPHGDSFEPMNFDADRIRAEDERIVGQGTRFYSVGAMHDASGALAALTQIFVDPDRPTLAFQGITAVTRPHRGHRLGLLVKAAMLEWLIEREPLAGRVFTFNAATNEHMIGVNEQLGFRVSDYFDSYEVDVAAAANLPVRPELA